MIQEYILMIVTIRAIQDLERLKNEKEKAWLTMITMQRPDHQQSVESRKSSLNDKTSKSLESCRQDVEDETRRPSPDDIIRYLSKVLITKAKPRAPEKKIYTSARQSPLLHRLVRKDARHPALHSTVLVDSDVPSASPPTLAFPPLSRILTGLD